MKFKKVIILSVAATVLAGCGNKQVSITEQEVKNGAVDAFVNQAQPIKEVSNAMAWIYRGKLGDIERASIEILEKSDVNVAVTFQYRNIMFTIDNVYRSREFESYRYESGDTVLSLNIDLNSGRLVRALVGTVQFNKHMKYDVQMYQDVVALFPYPINRFNGVPDSLVAASVREMQKIVATKDKKALAMLCEWPLKYHGMDIADISAFMKEPSEDIFSSLFCEEVASSYDYFFYYENEIQWYCFGRGSIWFIVKDDGSIRIKSINIPSRY